MKWTIWNRSPKFEEPTSPLASLKQLGKADTFKVDLVHWITKGKDKRPHECRAIHLEVDGSGNVTVEHVYQDPETLEASSNTGVDVSDTRRVWVPGWCE